MNEITKPIIGTIIAGIALLLMGFLIGMDIKITLIEEEHCPKCIYSLDELKVGQEYEVLGERHLLQSFNRYRGSGITTLRLEQRN